MGLWRIKFVTLITTGLWVVASLAIGLPRTLVDPLANELRDLISPNEQCPQPCWQGIQPAITSSTDAIARLKSMTWTSDISAIQGIVTNDSIIQWKWNGQQSGIIDGQRQGTIWLHNGLVYSIELPLNVTFVKAWQAVGKPHYTLITKAPRAIPSVTYHALFAEGLIDLYGLTPCPLNAWNLLSMSINARFASEKPRTSPTQASYENRNPCNPATH